MKRAPAVKQGAAVAGTPIFPQRTNTVTAEVLAWLLRGETLTSLDSVFGSSTTRLSAFIFTHVGNGWEIESEPFAAGCKDGRVSWPHKYYLRTEVIAKAGPGAAAWCAAVFKARRDLRRKAAQAEREAARLNAMRRASSVHPGQLGLDLGGAA